MMIFTEICELFIPFWDHLIIFNGNKRFPSFIVGYAMCFIPGAVRIFAQGPLFRICQYFIMMTRKHLEYKGFRQSKCYLKFFFHIRQIFNNNFPVVYGNYGADFSHTSEVAILYSAF